MPNVRRFHAPVILPADPAFSVLRNAVLDVGDDGRIGYCGPASEAPNPGPSTAVTDIWLTGILMPGLVNTHAHSAMTLLRGAGADLPLMPWLQDVIWPAEARMRPSDAYAGMVIGCVEMLGFGVTTSAEMYRHPEQVVTAALDVGSRVLVAPALFDLPGSDWLADLTATSRWIDSDGLRFGPAERIELCYGPHSAYTMPPEALRVAADAAAERDALVHIHLAESLAEDQQQRSAYGSVPQLLKETGLLQGRLLAAHSVHLSDADIELLAEHGTGIAHCPGSNAKLASGTAPLAKLRKALIPVGLGTDGPASNDDLDLWEEMRLAMMFARLNATDSQALIARDALLMATRGGAEALGRSDIGTLHPGAWADMVHISVDGLYFAAGLDIPDEQLLSNLVWAAGSREVRDVWVGGEQVVANSQTVRVDLAAARHAAAESAAYITSRT